MTDPTMDDASNAALAKTPSSRKTFAASMPVSWQNARTPSRAKTPGAAKTPARFGLAKTPGGKPKTPGISSRFAQAPERVVVDVKPKPKTPGGYHRQLMLPLRKTPGKQPMVNPAPSMLSSLPNATHATFWLRKATREEERTGDLVQALYHLDTGIKRGAEPIEHLQDAKDALRSRMNSSATDATDANETEADTTDADAMSGSVVVMATVRTPNRLLDAVDGHKTVVTPVRRSARKTPDADGVSHHSSSVQRAMTHNSIQRTLSANDYAYAPNDALGNVHAHDEEVAAAAESLDEDAKLINAIGNNNDDASDAFDANAENKEFAQLEAEAAFAAASEEATVAANAAVRATSNGRSFTVNSSGKKSKGVVYTDSRGGRPSSLSKARSLDAPLRQSPTDKTARKMSFSSQSGSDSGNEARTLDANSPAETKSVVTAPSSVELLTPNSEFAAMEAAAEAAAARARGTGALARSSSIPANYSPMKPPQSPASTKKSAAMARAASLAAAMSRSDADAELDAAATVSVPMFEPATFESPASMVSPTALLPNLPTPTLRLPTPTLAQEAAMAKTPAPVPVAISTFGPSPGKAAREAAEAAGESPTDAVAEAVARATPYSCVDTSRRDRNRAARTTPSPVSFQTSQEETPGAEFARLEAEAAAEAAAEARADMKWAEALAAAERKAAEADEMDDFVFPTRESPGQRDDSDSIEDATVAIPTVGFMPAPAEEDDDACDMEEEAEDRTVAIPTIGFRPVPITPGGYLDRYRHTPAAAAAAATGLTPAFKLLAMQAQSPAIAKMAALSASVVAESAATKSAVKAPRSPVKFTTVPTPRFEQEDDEKVLDAPSPVMEEEEEEEEVVEEPSPMPMPMDEDVAPMQEDTRSPMPAPVVQDTTRMSSPMSSRAPSSPTIEQIAPNAAALIATPGSAKKTSPLSVFARMMAKVINDTHEELSKSVVKHRARELMEAEGTAVDDLTAVPSPPKSAARLPSPAARTPTVSTTVTTLNGLSPVAMEEGETTPPATVPSPMGSIKGSPAIRVPSGHPAAGVPEVNSEVLNSPAFDNSTGLTPALARMGIQPHVHAATPVTPADDLVNEDGFETDEATPLGVVIHAGTPMATPRTTRNSLTKARKQKRASAMKSVDRLHAGVATGRPRTPASVGTGMKGKKPPVSPARGGGGSRSSKKSSMGAAAAAAAAGATPGTHGGLRRSKRLSAGSETPTSAKKQWEN